MLMFYLSMLSLWFYTDVTDVCLEVVVGIRAVRPIFPQPWPVHTWVVTNWSPRAEDRLSNS